MSQPKRLAKLAAILGSLSFVLLHGCDFSPTAPFEGFDGQVSNDIALSGRFASRSGSSSALRAFSQSAYEGMTVEVVGTGISTRVGSDGTFTLRGLPEGSFQLVFRDQSGHQLGDPLTFHEVLPNQEITIVVEVVNGSVRVIEEKRTGIGHGDVEIEGIARNIQVTGGNGSSGTLEVNGIKIVCRANETAIRKGDRRLTLRDIRDGDRVHVKGVWETAADGSQQVFAHEIKLQDEEDDQDDTASCSINGGKVGERIELEGIVVRLGNSSFELDAEGRSSKPIQVNFGSASVTCNDKKAPSCAVGVGDRVHVRGVLESNCSVTASEVKIQKKG